MTPDRRLAAIAEPLPAPIPDWPRAAHDVSLRIAARIAAQVGAEGLILTDAGMPSAIVHSRDILLALSRDEDPVTGLPRSGPLRDWLVERTLEGKEISVVFLDLDGFGEINRAHGHAEGDSALRRAAECVASCCSDDDFPSRFGGDEFAIGSLRNRAGVEELGDRIGQALGNVGLPAACGVAGGRRAEARADAHTEAMVEELLRLASLACMHNKARE